jgi:hypothetical protein
MANCGHWFSALEESPHELHGFRLHPQLIGIGHPTRKQQGVKVLCVRIVESDVDGKRISRLELLPPLYLLLGGRYDPGLRSGTLESSLWLGELGLLRPTE